MPRIYLIRHGEVGGNSGPHRFFAGWRDVPLLPRGEAQAQAIASRLGKEKLAAVYSSDLQRARQTAQAIAGAQNLEVQADAGLREVNYGAWEGMGEDELLRDWRDLWKERVADPLNVSPPDGESYADLQSRVVPAWQQIVARHGEDEERIAVVGHNGSLRMILCQVLGVPPQNARRILLSNCGLSRVDIRPAKESGLAPEALVAFVNDTAHLMGI